MQVCVLAFWEGRRGGGGGGGGERERERESVCVRARTLMCVHVCVCMHVFVCALIAKLRRTYPCGNVKSNCNFVFHNGERKEIT